MEEEGKKQPGYQVDQEQKQDDDEKIEKFFAIIRRLKDARNCSTNSLREMEARKAAKKAKKLDHKIVPVWTPSFQVEDFANVRECLEITHATQPSSSNKGCEKGREEELDLNLSL